jgi:hypothetical protein
MLIHLNDHATAYLIVESYAARRPPSIFAAHALATQQRHLTTEHTEITENDKARISGTSTAAVPLKYNVLRALRALRVLCGDIWPWPERNTELHPKRRELHEVD